MVTYHHGKLLRFPPQVYHTNRNLHRYLHVVPLNGELACGIHYRLFPSLGSTQCTVPILLSSLQPRDIWGGAACRLLSLRSFALQTHDDTLEPTPQSRASHIHRTNRSLYRSPPVFLLSSERMCDSLRRIHSPL